MWKFSMQETTYFFFSKSLQKFEMIIVEIYCAKNIAEVSFKLISLKLEIHCSCMYLDLYINDQL